MLPNNQIFRNHSYYIGTHGLRQSDDITARGLTVWRVVCERPNRAGMWYECVSAQGKTRVVPQTLFVAQFMGPEKVC